ncbi:MAG: RNA polymerase sigma factor RpoD [Myxococcota bacterium]|nr:RNA polymerase sigma factor RpoD [Myxococcota bacterium]
MSEHRKKGRRRSKTISCKSRPREGILSEEDRNVLGQMEEARPKRRDDCRAMPRPCLFVSCKHHLYLDVNPITGSIKINFPDKEPWELEETCALDVADRGGITLEEVGQILNLTRERIRQVEVTGLKKLNSISDEAGLSD